MNSSPAPIQPIHQTMAALIPALKAIGENAEWEQDEQTAGLVRLHLSYLPEPLLIRIVLDAASRYDVDYSVVTHDDHSEFLGIHYWSEASFVRAIAQVVARNRIDSSLKRAAEGVMEKINPKMLNTDQLITKKIKAADLASQSEACPQGLATYWIHEGNKRQIMDVRDRPDKVVIYFSGNETFGGEWNTCVSKEKEMEIAFAAKRI